MFQTFEAPTIFYYSDEVTDYIYEDLEKAGYAGNEITYVRLDAEELQEIRLLIDKELKTPFIYFPVEKKTDCECFFLFSF